MATREVFSEDELAQLRGFPEPARAELIRYFTLAPADEAFVRKFRGQDTVLGAAVQLWWPGCRSGWASGSARCAGTVPVSRPAPVICARSPDTWGWRTVDGPRWKELEEFLFARAMEHDSPKLLFRQACEYLSSSRLVRPGVVKILERVAAARERAREETWTRVAPLLGPRRQAELDAMLTVDPVLGRTRLSWLGTGPVAATPAAVKDELEKLAYLRGLDADTLDMSVLPAERRRFLAGVGRRLTPQHLARREPARRYPILLTLIAQSAVDVLDESLLLSGRALSGRESAARARLTEMLAERARGGEEMRQCSKQPSSACLTRSGAKSSSPTCSPSPAKPSTPRLCWRTAPAASVAISGRSRSHVMDSLPRNAVGKVAKPALRALNTNSSTQKEV